MRRNRQPPPFDLDEQLAPALSTLAHPGLEADQLLLALPGGADQHQDALRMILHVGLQVDTIGPDIDIPPRREIPRLPTLILDLPFTRDPANGGGREVRSLLAEQG